MSATPCPICSSRDLRRVDDAWRCNRCDTLFAVTEGRTIVRIAGEAPPVASSSGRVGAMLAATLVVGGAGLWWSQRAPSPAPVEAMSQAEPPRQRPRPEPRERLPRIELPHIVPGTLDDGTMYWLVTYRNLGVDAIENLSIVAQFYDGGTLTGEFRGEAPVLQLGPDDDTIVLVVAEDPPAHTRVEVAADPPRFAKMTEGTVNLGTDGVHLETTRSGEQLTGRIRNPHGFKVKVTEVVVVGRDRNGRPVAWAPAGPDEPFLRAGDETIFEARPGIYQIAEPAVWTAFAVGTPQKDN